MMGSIVKKNAIVTFMLITTWFARILFFIYSKCTNKRKSEKHTILIVRLDRTVGDTVMNSLFLKNVRKLYPASHIILVIHKNISELVLASPCFDELYCYNPGASLKVSLLTRLYKTFHFSFHNLKTVPNLAIVPRYDEDHNAAFISLFSLAKQRVSYSEKVTDRKALLNYSFDSLYTDILFNKDVKHEVDRGNDLLSFLVNKNMPKDYSLDVWLTKKEVESAYEKLSSKGVNRSNFFLCLGLSSGYSKLKQWPLEYFNQLVNHISLLSPKVVVVLLGTGNDKEQGDYFKSILSKNIKVVDFIGDTTLKESAAIIANCDLYIGNDSGNMHLASATGIPVIGLFGSSCSHRFSPWGKNCSSISVQKQCGPCAQGHKIDRCSVCIHDEVLCMTELHPEMVINKVKEYL